MTLPTLAATALALAAAPVMGQGQVVGWGSNLGGEGAPAPVPILPFVSMASGAVHNLMVRADGTVLAQGYNRMGQCTVPASVGGIVAVAGGMQHSLALQSSGRVIGWGQNDSGESLGTGADGAAITGMPDGSPVRVGGAVIADVIRISAGGAYFPVEDLTHGHSLGLRRGGAVVAWGYGLDGQVAVPAAMAAASRIAAGGRHSLALRPSDGAVIAWGLNDRGQCGGSDANGAARTGPTVGGLSVQLLGQPLVGVTEVAAGDMHSVALRGDGTVACWGSDLDFDQSFAGQATVPAGLQGVVGIAAGGWHTVARLANGQAACWGSNVNFFNSTGNAEYSGQSVVPGDAEGLAQVSAGWFHSMALKRDGRFMGWGWNIVNLLDPPSRVDGIVRIDAGGGHVLASRSDGSLVSWGVNDVGQRDIPPGLQGVIDFACRDNHSLTLRGDGTFAVWGMFWNFHPAPVGPEPIVPPTSLPPVGSVGTGTVHMLAVLRSGQVRAWGRNDEGQCLGTDESGQTLRTESRATGLTPVRLMGSVLDDAVRASGGVVHSIALRADGSVAAWGDAYRDATAVPADLSGVTRIATGEGHSLALRSNGTVVAWGSNQLTVQGVEVFTGQSIVPEGLSGVVDVAAGEAHSVALRSNGTVVSWGSNINRDGDPTGQSIVLSNLSGVTAIGCGDWNSFAVLSSSLSDCAGATAPGQATLKVNGSAWQDVNIWQWSDTGPRVPGALSDVDLGTYGSVGLDCDAHAGTLTMHPGSSLVVPFDLDARVPAAAALQVSGTASLAGRVWLLASGDADRLPADLHVPVLECSSPSGTNFGFIQSSVPAPDGMFLTLSTEVVAGRTGFALTLAPLTVTGSLSSTSARPFSGKAVAAATIDVNHDGLDDLALAVDNGVSSPGALQVLLNDPSNPGTLGTGSLYLALPPRPSCLAVGDLDGDGFKDVVVGLSSDDTVRVFTGNAGGTLAPGLVIGSVTGSPLSVAVIEPGSPLLPSSGTVSVGTSSSKVQTFSSAGTTLSTVTISGPATVMAVGSADGTRGRDIATGGTRSSSVNGFASGAETGFVEVLVDSGSGYVVSSSVSLTGEPVGIDMADLDGDGLDDIVTANANPQLPASGSVLPVLSILRNASGSFDGAIAYQPSGSSAGLSVTMLDVDGDGDRDIVSVFTVVGTDSAASLLRVDSSGAGGPISVGSETPLPSEDPVLAARGELDGTGEEDAYLVDENAAPPSLVGVRAARPFLSSATPVGVPGDLDGDGHVNTADLALLLLDFGPCPGCVTDLDGTGEVDTSDLALLLLLFD